MTSRGPPVHVLVAVGAGLVDDRAISVPSQPRAMVPDEVRERGPRGFARPTAAHGSGWIR